MNKKFFVNSLHNNIKNSVFIKIFILFLIATSIPTICVSLLSIKHSSTHIIDQMDYSVGAVLSDKKHIIDQRFKELDKSILQLFTSNEIWKFMTDENLSGNSYIRLSSFKIVDIFKVVYSTIQTNKLVDSIYIYNTSYDFVLTDTKYTKNEFYDQEILGLSFEGYEYLTRPRVVNDEKIISYIRKFEVFPKRNLVYAVINANYDKVFTDLNIPDMKYPYGILIFDKDNNIIYESNALGVKLENEDINGIMESGWGGNVKKISGSDFYFKKTSLETSGYVLVYMQKYSHLVQEFNLVNKMIVSSLIIILVLSFITACFFSLYVYRPLDLLVRNVKKCLSMEELEGNNVYNVIELAVKILFKKNNELANNYKLVLPYLEKYSIHDLLTNKNTDAKNYKCILEALGIQFIYGWYEIALIDFENTELTDETIRRLKAYFNNYQEEFVYVLSIIKANRIVIIINIDKGMETIYAIFQKMKEEFNREDMDMTISLGKMCDNLDNIMENYGNVVQQLENKFFAGINEIIYTANISAEGKNSFYDKSLEEELLNCIRQQNLEKAKDVKEKLIDDIVKNINTIDFIKYNCFRIISDILYVLSELGIDSSETGFSSTSIFEEIHKITTLDSIRNYIEEITEMSISLIAKLKKSQHKELVAKTMGFLKANYHKDLTLDDISNSLFISPRYLCGIFKSVSGMTIFEYITILRMEAAKDLLKDNKKISDIAMALGYNNIQSFIRFFKKYFKMTPVQYRRKHFAYTITEQEDY